LYVRAPGSGRLGGRVHAYSAHRCCKARSNKVDFRTCSDGVRWCSFQDKFRAPQVLQQSCKLPSPCGLLFPAHSVLRLQHSRDCLSGCWKCMRQRGLLCKSYDRDRFRCRVRQSVNRSVSEHRYGTDAMSGLPAAQFSPGTKGLGQFTCSIWWPATAAVRRPEGRAAMPGHNSNSTAITASTGRLHL
jgi:hypothetical protein